jgi:hypothetical protein
MWIDWLMGIEWYRKGDTNIYVFPWRRKRFKMDGRKWHSVGFCAYFHTLKDIDDEWENYRLSMVEDCKRKEAKIEGDDGYEFRVRDNYGDTHLEITCPNGHIHDILVRGIEEDAMKHSWESLSDQLDRMNLPLFPQELDEQLPLVDDDWKN